MKTLVYLIGTAMLSTTALSQVIYNNTQTPGQTAYDINFQTADQPVNQPLITGPAPNHVSSIPFGTPVVVSSYGSLTDQPLLFNSNNQSAGQLFYYTQIGLTLSSMPMSSVDLSFDMFDTGAGHFMTVLFDTPSVRNFQFYNGQISFNNPFLPNDNFGNYQMGQAYHFDIHVDYTLNQWTFSENDSVLGSGAFDGDGNTLRSIRFNYAANGPNISGTAIDNILVTTVPEPSSLAIIGTACCAIFTHRLRKH